MYQTLKWAGLICLLAGVAAAANDPFVGKWKLNQDKSKITGEQVKIQDLGNNKYKFIQGDISNTITADGTDQPLQYGGGTWSLKQEGPDTWKEIRKQDGTITSEWAMHLNGGGNVLTIHITGTHTDGSSFVDNIQTRRIGSGTGLAGTWQSTQYELSQPMEQDIESYDGDGLSFITPANKDILSMKFDGKAYSGKGPRATPGEVTSGHRINPHTLEITDKLKGRLEDNTQFKVSQDGQTLTLTIHEPGQKSPLMIVYDRL